VDDASAFERLMRGIDIIARDVPIVFPVHPRTRPVVTRSATAAAMVDTGRLRLVDPLGYLDFIGLMERARIVLTDSGGVQEETTILGVPCLTLRENTERPVTITHGTNQLVGTDTARMGEAWARVKASAAAPPAPPLWDGQAAERIADVLARYWD
jgi:UDP-N-acetylglucosamine 2-epimerase (non-hydrolysing)